MAEITIRIERHEARQIQNRVDHARDRVRGVFDEECAKLLKKKGIDNATPPFELVLNFPGASLIYHES